ncbi:Ribonuclease H-like domain,HAT, C-terminal dimerisation domain [Cinara cedri]|uniref:Ribonuclease H-like domain,HAT, C-terminal dimerisation domain n=1 Tax=Cinara cedri TaxID=506608 RepID=A0A5E4M1D5_9HEMI|nr:Ribonuclease H-like domain,HAT, C-terminal dimerisation domain [Cinara cedri]
MKCIFEDHLSQIVIWFEKYFQNENKWIQVPFNSFAPTDFDSIEKESLIELFCDNSLKAKFGRMDLIQFWISMKDEYSLLSDKAQRILISFSTSYLCETGFSVVAVIKTKHRSKKKCRKRNESGCVYFNSKI